MPVWEFALVILLLVLAVLVIYLIPLVINFNRTLKKISNTVDTINEDLPDILYDLSEITYSASAASKRIEKTIENISDLERTISHEIREPLLETTAAISGFLNAIRSFFNYFIKRK